ncbi:hypothetical protein ACJ73_08814 [Blastomyces percursus]|uniref:Uncharacterized protein n=1 Tax=Blastomyces percursus TaxID=1658174 RepID=A0A1J9QN31_9EURO|nr:hypothetical protein ACJ73_08814 [Blastomyces percursus]
MSGRLLKVHRAIALILKLSGAGEYIEDILRDMEDVKVEADGSTNLGRLLSLRLGCKLSTDLISSRATPAKVRSAADRL